MKETYSTRIPCPILVDGWPGFFNVQSHRHGWIYNGQCVESLYFVKPDIYGALGGKPKGAAG